MLVDRLVLANKRHVLLLNLLLEVSDVFFVPLNLFSDVLFFLFFLSQLFGGGLEFPFVLFDLVQEIGLVLLKFEDVLLYFLALDLRHAQLVVHVFEL